MALVTTGNGITDIRGGLGGVYFHRDRSGLHCCSKPRTVHRRSSLQDSRRRAFARARTFSHVNRTVSYNIYRAMLNLPMAEPPIDYQIPRL